MKGMMFMNSKVKRIILDLCILVIPVVAMIFITPYLPEQIPMQWNASGEVNWSIPNKFGPLLGLIPFILYELIRAKYDRRKNV
ncbi:MAG: DUF1648 domain-containing protein [Erysipelotrichales bacterium]|jgi:uncharacterized membrane protein|nr:DUF1648 domain-containing protein [Erysipelotrichales bacterium]